METETWVKESEILKAYVDTAKTYIQLSSAGLALPIILREKLAMVLRPSNPLQSSAWVLVVLTWAAFLVAVCAGALYQFASAKYIEKSIDPGA